MSAVYPLGQTANTPKSPLKKGVYNANYALTLLCQGVNLYITELF